MSDGFFDRLANLVKGATSNFLKDLESDNPEAVYQATIEAALERLHQTRDGINGLKLQRDRLDKDIVRLEAEVDSFGRLAGQAVDLDEAKALEYLEKKEAANQQLEAVKARLPEIEAQLKESEASLEEQEAQVKALKAEKDLMLVKLRTLESQNERDGLSTGVPSHAAARALQTVRDQAGKAEKARVGLTAQEKKALSRDKAAEQLEALKKAVEANRPPKKEASKEDGSAPSRHLDVGEAERTGAGREDRAEVEGDGPGIPSRSL